MTINYRFGDGNDRGATLGIQAAWLEAERQAIVSDVQAAGDFWGGAGSAARQEFTTQLGRNFQMKGEQANAHGPKRCKPPAAIWRAPIAPLALAAPKTSRSNESEYFKHCDMPKFQLSDNDALGGCNFSDRFG